MKRYRQKVFRNDYVKTQEKARQWAAENLTCKWDLCLTIIGNKVRTVIEWYEEV